MHTFIELWNPTDRWRELSAEERKAFMEGVGQGMEQLSAAGVETLGWGSMDGGIDAPAPYRYFAIWRAPDAHGIEVMQAAVAESGWYDLFEQVNAGGALQTPDEVIADLIQSDR